MSRRPLSVSLVVVFLLSVLPAAAQGTTAVLKGRVVDSAGDGVPGVPLQISSRTQPSGNTTSVTDIEGNFRAALLPPAADYVIRVDYPGFGKIEIGPIDVAPSRTVVQNLTLRSDTEVITEVHVVDALPTVDLDNPAINTVFNEEFLEALPLIGHNWQSALVLAPGVTDTDGDGNPNVRGSRDTGLQTRIDGANITDPVSGTFGQNLNQDIIQAMEVITAAASADNGRADGGFVNIITKSGGNDFEGKLSLFWQGKLLDGSGANNNDVSKFDGEFPNFQDFRPSLSLGGALVRDRIWYFGSLQMLDTERPVNQVGSNILITSRGHSGFGKVTWQVNSTNKLALQVSTDPREFSGLGLALGVSPDSDFTFTQGGLTPQIKWTAALSPQLLLEASISRFESGIAITPVSEYFTPTDVREAVVGNTVQALYPCEVLNCNPSRGEKRMYQQDLITGGVTGPFNVSSDDKRSRSAIKTDLSYSIEDAWGQHSIKAGMEFADETFENEPITNPLLVDVTQPFQQVSGGGPSFPDMITGVQQLQTFSPLATPQRAASFNSGVYLLDAWKPRPNLSLNVGVRLDREDVDTSGFDFFDPRSERRRSVALWSAFCAEARAQGVTVAGDNCHEAARYNGLPPTVGDNFVSSFRDSNGDGMNDVAAEIASMDLNGDGLISTSGQVAGTEGFEFYREFTRFNERETQNFSIVNSNLSPRVSVSWDPWSDGRTKVFGTFSRFYDRLFLATVTGEIGPDNVNFIFVPDENHVIVPGSGSRAASTVSVTQVDRDMRTPYTDEVTIGFERELAPEWALGLSWISRKGVDLLQDMDVNHVTCPQYGQLGIDPMVICGDAGQLEIDRFGDVAGRLGSASEGLAGGNFGFNATGGGGARLPNGAPDLYTVNNGFNQVLRIGNFNSSRFESWELRLTRRLARNWQMQASYTWSEAFGQAEAFQAAVGNDPETVDDEEGYLAFDQRHVLKFQAVTRLKHEITAGAVLQWASGTPFSLTRTVVDLDSTGNTIFRSLFPTGQRNDQRNEGQWRVDTHLEKAFRMKRVQASGFLNVQNLLNSDDLVITQHDLTALDGVGLQANRNFGRRFELGASFNF